MTPQSLVIHGQAPPLSIDRRQVGGKAANLIELARHGFQVPPFLVVSAAAFRSQIAAVPQLNSKIQRLASQPPDQLNPLAAEIRAQILSTALPPALVNEIRQGFEAAMASDLFVAVRSSASDEDGLDHSFAGMHDSFLFVQGLPSTVEMIQRVWASAFNDRAVAYRTENRLDVSKIAVAVVVQQMIDPAASGVVFTVNPATDRTDEIVISALYGVGEGLVSGGLAADTFTVHKGTREVSSDLVCKSEQVILNPQNRSGVITRPVPQANQTEPCLNAEQIHQITDVSIQIENAFRRPQDIEFCLDQAGRLYVLQSRPITRIKQYGPAAGHRLVWDNSNIIESYSGVTSPMTFSFIRRAYTIVYHCFAQVMGIGPKKVQASRHVFENMLGLIRGRVYYNLQNWYRLIRLFPGFQYNAQFMESMMGLKEPLILDDPIKPVGFWRKWFVELPALVRLVLRTSWNFLRIKSIVNEFQASFHAHYDKWQKLNFDQLAPHQLRDLYNEMEDALLWNWKAPIINDFYVMIYYGLLKKLCEKWVHDETGALQNDLICGEGGVESAEPAKMLLRLAALAADRPELRDAIFVEPLESVPAAIQSNAAFSDFNELMEEYLERFGFRCMNELKLEEYSLRDRPHLVYQVLRNYLSLPDRSALDVDAMNKREQQIRRDAEQKAFSSIRGFRLLPRKAIFRRVVRNARMGVKNRENMRFARTRIYGLLREILRSLGRQMAAEEILDDREDIFYLTIDEVWDYLKGTAVTTDLKSLVRLRRNEFDRYRDEPAPDDRFETFGFAYHKNLFANANQQPVELDDGQLRGIGCCPGEVTNAARVLRSPSDNLSLSGEVLVAERTDPGWVPLYPAVSGILIERGSILSHSAVVAREMGIPTIVGIRGLLEHVADGDVVNMNGRSGVAKVVKKRTDQAD